MMSKTMERQKARLENWSLEESPIDPERRVLWGNVYGHPRFEDGTLVRTSRVVEANVEERWAKTLNTDYTLGISFDEAVEAWAGKVGDAA